MTAVIFALLTAAEPCGAVTRESIDLRSCWVTDADLPGIAGQAALKRLDLSMTRITDQGLLRLKDLPGIEELNLRYAELITDEGMSAIKGWKRLRTVDLRGTKVTDTTLGYLGGLTSLESIDVGFAQISDNGIEALAALPKLKRLTLGGNKLTDTGMQALRLMTALEYLDLSGPQRTDSGLWSVSLTEPGIAAVAAVGSLRELRIGGANVGSNGLEELRRGLPKLERLSLHRCKRVTDEAVAVLSEWRSLVEVDLKDTKISEAGVARLRAALPGCKVRGE